MVRRITTRDQLIDLAKELEVGGDWHEPDEQDVTATTHGVNFDNAGFWADGRDHTGSTPEEDYTELHVILHKDDKPVAAVNLATLFAWATGIQGD